MMESRDVQIRQARRALEAGDSSYAESVARRLLSAKSKDPDALELLGRACTAQDRHAEAVQWLGKCVRLLPKDPSAHFYLAQALTSRGDYGGALTRYQKVLRLSPDHPAAITGIAEVHLRRGAHAKAVELLQPLLERGSETPDTMHVLARCHLQFGAHEEAIAAAERRLDEATPALRRRLLLLAAKAHERAGRPDEAFEAASRAHAPRAAAAEADADRRCRRIDELISVYAADTMARLPRCAERSDLPVFIVGMPRSGSTLIERIIDAHPQAHGAGEIALMHRRVQSFGLDIGATEPHPACVPFIEQEDVDRLGREHVRAMQALSRPARRVVDKYLTNIEHVGLIELLMPGARIIHSRRDPLDTCLSCFFEPLPLPAHDYAGSLRSLGRVHSATERLMRHWQAVSSLPQLVVEYEALVADAPTHARRIIEFLDLPWDERCLRFYESGSESLTLSRDQVRRPVYSTSVGRAGRFGAHLQPLLDALSHPDR